MSSLQSEDETRREALIRALPYARRYARALTGSQVAGDTLVAESLKVDAGRRCLLRTIRGWRCTNW